VNRAAAAALRQALLYEGYLLYPYRASALKNRQRFSLAVLYPPAFCAGGDTSSARTECLVRGGAETVVEVEIAFLHLLEREGAPAASERTVAVPELHLGELGRGAREERFAFAQEATEGARQEPIAGSITITAEALDGDVYKLGVEVRNLSRCDEPGREAALLRSLVSAHTLIGVRAGELVSLLDPPPSLAAAAAACANVGTWPVLVGAVGSHDTLLSSPVILYDYPQVAPESPGDLFDATEIDEILTLRILTLTDAEKRELRASDARARALIDRTEALGAADLMRLHGTLRYPSPPRPARCLVGGVALGPGDRVRLRPRGRADIFDLALAGMLATVTSVEQDFEDRFFVCVTIDDDPGRDLGATGQPGHRFFFRADEVEPVA
jgi:hypothetical protein